MKILLLGEFSGLHNNLKDGLIELGHEVIIASAQDGSKKISVDINFESKLPSIFKNFGNKIINPILNLNKLKNFDIVQIINPFEFYSNFIPTSFFLDQIINNNNKTFLLAAGSDSYFWRNGKNLLKYGPFEESLAHDYKSKSHFMESNRSFEYNKHVVEKVRGVIPIMYEYELSYRGEDKLLETIPIPINTDKIEYKKNLVTDKIKVFHGLNRYGFKGTRYVEDAFKYLQNYYPNELELKIEGKLPINKYLELLNESNVVIDQVLSHSSGLNGLYALAMGKVVLGGAEPESFKSLGIKRSPVINIKPNKESIIEAIEYLIFNKHNIPDIGEESRLFIENYHNYILIAKKYIDVWNNN